MGGSTGNKLSNINFLKALNEAGLYTMEQLQTPGLASVHWENITNKEEYVNSLISLTDTPSAYTGAGTYKLVIKATEDGIEFVPDTTDGTDGREIELQKSATHIQWRYVGEASWTDLVLLSEITGPQGEQGDQGIQGIQGPPGVAGTDGTDGTNGADGTDGNSIRATEVEPTTEGIDYDLRLLTTNWDVYEKKPTTGWEPIGNIKGATGDPGVDGVDGADGDTYYYNATDTRDLSTFSVGDNITFTVANDLSYSQGQYLVAQNSASLYIIGKVVSYVATTVTIEITYREGTASASSWDINLAGVVEAEIGSGWYKITATAGTGTLASREFTGPTGWNIGAANTISVPDIPGDDADDLIIQHSLGLNAVDCIVYIQESTYNTKATGTSAYGTMYEDQNNTAIKLTDLSKAVKPLIIYVKLH